MPAESAIGMLPVVLIVVSSTIVFGDLKSVRWKIVLTFSVFTIPGIFAGIKLLQFMHSNTVIIVVTTLILLHCIYSLFVRFLVIPSFMIYPLAVVSGVVMGGAGLGMLHVPLTLQKIRKPNELRVTMNLFWVLFSVVRLPGYLASEIISPELLLTGVMAIPGILLLMFAGRKVRDLFDVESFNKAVLISLGLISLVRLIIGIMAI